MKNFFTFISIFVFLSLIFLCANKYLDGTYEVFSLTWWGAMALSYVLADRLVAVLDKIDP